MSHDQLFKELLRTFFAEFLQLFFPKVAQQLDFTSVQFLEQELFTDFPDGDTRRTDTLAQVKTQQGQPEIVLFHIETETTRRNEFRFRMWEYYALLRLRTKKPVFPIVIYLSPGTGGLVPETYRESVFGYETLVFTYQALGLPDLEADEYLSGESLVGVALSALMRPSGLGSVLQKWSSLRKIVTSGLDESGKILLSNVVESYLVLSVEEAGEFSLLVEQESSREVSEMVSIYELRGIEKGIEQGIEKGIEQGIVSGMQRTLLRQLEVRFGSVSFWVREVITGISDVSRLESLSVGVLTAPSIEALLGDSLPKTQEEGTDG